VIDIHNIEGLQELPEHRGQHGTGSDVTNGQFAGSGQAEREHEHGRIDSTDAASTTTLRTSAKDPALLAPRVDNTVVANTATPTVASRSRLRARALNGLGRLLRRIDQAVLIAYCTAWATPRPP
jgi:hypothetical protein